MVGIYGIRNKINGKMYVGQSVNVSNRFIRHKTLLKHNKHYNRHLQNSYNKHGLEQFEFIILEKCEERLLDLREQHWIDNHDKSELYNHELFIEDRSGCRNSFYGKHHTAKTKKKMSSLKNGIYNGADNPNFGNRWSESQKNHMRGDQNTNAKLNKNNVIEIKEMLSAGIKHIKIAEKFSVSRTVITRINSGTRWGHIKLEEECQESDSIVGRII
jgi:group I intron endonuclease